MSSRRKAAAHKISFYMKAYRLAAVASTFSPTHEAVLAEADSFARKAGANLVVLHASEKTQEKEERFRESLSAIGRKSKVHWVSGDSPPDALIAGAREAKCDLLIAGAPERGDNERTFTGSVAKRLLRESPCDVLLVPKPEVQPAPIGTALFAVEPGQKIGGFVREVVKALKLEAAVLAVAETPFAKAIAASKGKSYLDTRSWAENLADSLNGEGISAEAFVINSNTGFGLCEAAQGFGSDLMVMRGRRRNGRIELAAHFNWVLQVIPSRLLLCAEEW